MKSVMIYGLLGKNNNQIQMILLVFILLRFTFCKYSDAIYGMVARTMFQSKKPKKIDCV